MNKRILSFVLSLVLVFGALSSGFAAPEAKLEDNTQVRVIVELEKEPIIKEAMRKNTSVDGLSAASYTKINTGILNQQQAVKNDIKSKNIDLDYHQSFTNVVNGFSATTTLAEVKKIEKMPGVKNVSIAAEYDRPQPLLDTSKDIMDTVKTWELDYKGEGLVVAIIDTGIDPNHQDMVLTNPENGKLKSKDVALKGLPGKYFTAKVPYGYNYMDNNDTILELGPEANYHGMHVAGTVGANGQVKGVSPEVQLLAMKVFGNDPGMPSTFGDVIIKAIDDSVKLGADVINLSLGSTSSFVREEDLQQIAVKNAVDAGVVCAISAGNSNHILDGYEGSVSPDNPDYGLVGSPGLTVDSLQVASVENTNIKADALSFDEKLIGYAKAGEHDAVKRFKGKKMEFIDAGDGSMEFLENAKGKVALVVRGGNTPNFTDKIQNAIKAEAAAIIVRNHEAGGDSLVNMVYPEGGNIPALFIGYKDGLTLIEGLKSEKNIIEFSGEKALILNPDAGRMSKFTSWGPTPNLGFKPEITGPGGQVYSTLQDNKYGIMSGTSMAAPHVSGGSALVAERVNKDFKVSGREKSELIKNLVMSTAVPLKERFGLTSPRRQGAGVMNVFAATTSNTIVTDSRTNLSKVELKEVGDKIEFTLKLKNFGSKALTYNIEGVVQTDVSVNGKNFNEPQNILNAPMVYTDSKGEVIEKVDVAAKGETEFKVSIDLSEAIDFANEAPLDEVFKNGTFVDGFISLKEETDTEPDLSIPYMGFYGKWGKAPIIDNSVYETDKASYYQKTGLAWLDGKTYKYLGSPFVKGDPLAKNAAFSPNGDGLNDLARPVLTFLRNAGEVEVNILNKNGEMMRHLSRDTDVRKNFFDNGRGTEFRTSDAWAWNGEAFGKITEGEYIYQIKTKIDFPGAIWQTTEFPIKIDLTKPVIESIAFDKEANKINVTASDNMTEIYKYQVVSKGEVLLETDKAEIDLSSLKEVPYEVTVKVFDYALNFAESKTINLAEDTKIPYVYIETPEAFGTVNTNVIPVKGNIVNMSNLKVLKINDKAVEFKYDKETKKYTFETEVRLEDGVHKINVYAENSGGNKINYERKIFVDTVKPELSILSRPGRLVSKDTKTVKAKIKIKENSGDVRVIVHGNEVFKEEIAWAYTNVFTPVEREIEVDIPLEAGENNIKIIVEDGFGNKTEESLGKVYKKVF